MYMRPHHMAYHLAYIENVLLCGIYTKLYYNTLLYLLSSSRNSIPLCMYISLYQTEMKKWQWQKKRLLTGEKVNGVCNKSVTGRVTGGAKAATPSST